MRLHPLGVLRLNSYSSRIVNAASCSIGFSAGHQQTPWSDTVTFDENSGRFRYVATDLP